MLKNSYTKIKIESTDTDFSYKLDNDILTIKFQGTVSLKDWSFNFMVWKKPYKNMKHIWFAHAGFVKKFKSTESYIKEIINEAIQLNVKEIFIKGHSQGGAIATLCHEYIWFNYPEQRKILTTIVEGSPKVIGLFSSLKIKERFENLTRIEQFWDIIIRVPFLLYRHVGKKIRVGNKWYQPTFRFIYTHLNYRQFR